MAFKRKELKYTLEDIPNIPKSEISQYRRSLAKRANQRMVEMIQSGAISRGQSAYTEIAVPYLTGKGRRRFNEGKTPRSFGEEEQELSKLIRFLEAETSTSAGLSQARKKTRKTLKKKFGVSLSSKKVDWLFSSGVINQLKALGIGSDDVMLILEYASKSRMSQKTLEKRINKLINKYEDEGEDSEIDIDEEFSKLFGVNYSDVR